MPDREKVIKGLERCKLYNKDNCYDCPYDYNGRGNEKNECTAELVSDVLALLKEQEAVNPIERNGFYYCGSCRYALMTNRQKYCSDCGRPVKWK